MLAHVSVPEHVPVPLLVLLIILWGPHTGIVQIHTYMHAARICLSACQSVCLSVLVFGVCVCLCVCASVRQCAPAYVCADCLPVLMLGSV